MVGFDGIIKRELALINSIENPKFEIIPNNVDEEKEKYYLDSRKTLIDWALKETAPINLDEQFPTSFRKPGIAQKMRDIYKQDKIKEK